MKSAVKVFAFIFSVAMMIACAGGESEVLKQARTIQDGLMKSKSGLDSTLDATITAMNTKISALSMDSIAMKDSSNMVMFTEMQSKVATLGEYKSKLMDWASNMKMLPSMEDLAKGAENPFGKESKDQDILSSIKAGQEQFNALKSEIETAIQ